jgi:hypothetical protein
MSQSGTSKRVPVSSIVIIIVVIAILVVITPGLLPNALSNLVPGIYEGVACANLRQGNNRAFHQSLLGRGATSPISLEVQTTGIPASADGFLTVYITMINSSYGTVPIVYNPSLVTVGDNGSSGLGIIFNPPNSLFTTSRQDFQQADSDLRLLAPRQRCVHQIDFPAGNVLVDPNLTSGNSTVTAFYRNNSQGVTVQPTGTTATAIFNDQGLWVGYVESPSVVIPRAPAPAS